VGFIVFCSINTFLSAKIARVLAGLFECMPSGLMLVELLSRSKLQGRDWLLAPKFSCKVYEVKTKAGSVCALGLDINNGLSCSSCRVIDNY
jgi:hypothetical protein